MELGIGKGHQRDLDGGSWLYYTVLFKIVETITDGKGGKWRASVMLYSLIRWRLHYSHCSDLLNCFHTMYAVLWSYFLLQKELKCLVMLCSYFPSLPFLVIRTSQNLAPAFQHFSPVLHVPATRGNASSLNTHRRFSLLGLCLLALFSLQTPSKLLLTIFQVPRNIPLLLHNFTCPSISP